MPATCPHYIKNRAGGVVYHEGQSFGVQPPVSMPDTSWDFFIDSVCDVRVFSSSVISNFGGSRKLELT
eukprot:1149107-Pelagomonas_calceolata.AAC.3